MTNELQTSAEVTFKLVRKHTFNENFSSILYEEMNFPFLRKVTEENELLDRNDSPSSGTSYKCSSGCTTNKGFLW